MKKNVCIICLIVFLSSMSFAQNDASFILAPEDIPSLEQMMPSHSEQGTLADILPEDMPEMACFPAGYSPLLSFTQRTWDPFCLEVKYPDDPNYSYEAVWLAHDQNTILATGQQAKFAFDTITEVYVSIIQRDGRGNVICNDIYPAAFGFLATYGRQTMWAIDHSVTLDKTLVNLDEFMGQYVHIIVNEFLVAKSFLVTPANIPVIVDWFNRLQLGTYRVQIAYGGHISQQHYFIRCDKDLDVVMDWETKNACPLNDWDLGTLHIDTLLGGSEHQQLLLVREGRVIWRSMYDDHADLSAENQEVGSYNLIVQDIFDLREKVYTFDIVYDSSVCLCVPDTVAGSLTVILETDATTSTHTIRAAQVGIYPNPVVYELIVDVSNLELAGLQVDELLYRVQSIGGEHVLTTDETTIDVAYLPPGIYILQVIQDTNVVDVAQFIK